MLKDLSKTYDAKLAKIAKPHANCSGKDALEIILSYLPMFSMCKAQYHLQFSDRTEDPLGSVLDQFSSVFM